MSAHPLCGSSLMGATLGRIRLADKLARLTELRAEEQALFCGYRDFTEAEHEQADRICAEQSRLIEDVNAALLLLTGCNFEQIERALA